jgi:hypothetical protein
MNKLLRFLFKPTVFLSLLLAISVVVGVYFYNLYRSSSVALDQVRLNPQAIALDEAKKVVEEVGKLMILPENEDPTVATVTDASLIDDPFFFGAENGDKLLIYAREVRQAILYRPSEHKIVAVAPVTLAEPVDQPVGPSVGEGEELQTVKLALYSGSVVGGLVETAKIALEKGLVDLVKFEVVYEGSAKSFDYTSTLVVDRTGNYGNEASQIANVLGGVVGELPEGETISEDVDILVIIVGE